MSDIASTDLVEYAMGYVVSPDGRQVVLLKKARPSYLAGKWMGVAGHVDEGETPLQAMRREFQEEAGVDIPEWTFIKILENPERPSKIYIFFACHDLSNVKTMTDEEVAVVSPVNFADISMGNALLEIEQLLRDYMATVQQSVPSSGLQTAPPATSMPVNGWVAVPAPSPDKVDGFVMFADADPANAWHFTIVNVSGSSELTVACSRLSEAIAEFALAHAGQQAAEIHFNESIAERLMLPTRYPIPA
jgi:8-oxo-dGTP pyrophosphatase MutT (NUDIX family)